MTKKLYLTGILVTVLAIGLYAAMARIPAQPLANENQTKREKIYIALEGEGKVAVVDALSRQMLTTIDLSESTNGIKTRYMPHNVQVMPDGSKVLVTANVEDNVEGEHGSKADMQMTNGSTSDQIIVIDPKTDTVTSRIPIAVESHLAHVVATTDGRTAYIALQSKDVVNVIDLTQGVVVQTISLGEKSGPHGLRLTPDGTQVIVALLGGKGVSFINTSTRAVRIVSLPGAIVQTAVTPDGAYAFGTIYDTKQIAWFSLTNENQGFISLPEGSKGPVQLYATPDSKFLYVADQGYYFDQPTGNRVYRINIAEKSVDQAINGGSAPHGVVVDKAGEFAYVTNLLSNDLSVIETVSGKEVARIPVGKMPNGISIWNSEHGGTQ